MKPSDRTGKAPGFWYYPADFEKDFQPLSLEAQGLGIRMLGWMHYNEAHRGFLELQTGAPMTEDDISARVGKPLIRVRRALEEMDHYGIFSRDSRKCIYSRRMARETHISEVRREAAKRRLECSKRAEDGTFAGDFAPPNQPPNEEQNPTVTASVSDSVSDSSITQPPPPDFSLSDWAEERYFRHPKKGHKVSAFQRLSEKSGSLDPQWRDDFTAKHEAWIASEEWRWKNGAKAPYFDEWIVDEGYLYDPPAQNGARVASESDSGAYINGLSSEEYMRRIGGQA